MNWFYQWTVVAALLLLSPVWTTRALAQETNLPANFQTKNIIAWCIVPFDAKKRNPSERAEMVASLGLQRVAYDWRDQHVASFEDEILQYKKRGIEYFAFWSWHDAIEPLIRKHKISPQIWITCPSPKGATDAEKTSAAAESLRPLAEKTERLGLKLGLYNHGGWGGEPTNILAVCKRMRKQHDTDRIGIVYNFHHGHEHIDDFSQVTMQLKPYLLCINLNGMRNEESVRQDPRKNKILTLGSGQFERPMTQAILQSGYEGPIGIIGHRTDEDVAVTLKNNLQGLQKLFQSKRND